MRSIILSFALLLGALLLAGQAFAHCQIPCGIYGDQMRTDMIAEHIDTVEKSMNLIMELENKDGPHNANQLTRWIMNKEDHAQKLQMIVYEYFLAQRIKAEMDKYTEHLKVLHAMIVEAMKCKQTVDLSHVEKLRELLKEFETLYFGHTHRE
jgi:nickel superoxide dismutase